MTDTSTYLSQTEPRRTLGTCVVCAIEVPLDEAVVPEVTDRLVYLCGLECYARWRGTAATSFPTLMAKPRSS
jgi:hypothetical protein